MKLQDQVALVTGAGGGIGTAIATTLARMGAHIAINDLNPEAAERLSAEVKALGAQTLVNTASVADFEAMGAFVDGTLDHFGRLDILVNNAGITRDALLVRMKEEQWDLVLQVHLKGAFCCTRAAARPMMKQRSGRIINIASVSGLMGNPGQANYSAAKGGIIALTKTTAKELAGRGITCNAVAPGLIQTPMTDALSEEAREALLGLIPLGEIGLPQDVANVVAFLASPEARYITGQVLNVDGGMVM